MRATVRILITFLIWSILLIISSCKFNPEGVNNIELPRKEPITTVFLNLNSDTLKTFGYSTKFEYNLDIENRKLIQILVYLDGSVFFSSHNLSGSFNFFSEEYLDGTHQLKIEVTTGSGTGSLAERWGREQVLYTKKWTMLIDNSYPPSCVINSIYPSNGSLKIEWPKYDKFNFVSYSVYKNTYFITEIKDKDSNFWFDSSFVGGSCDYRVDIKAAFHYKQGVSKNYSFNLQAVSAVTPSDSGKLIISWQKNIFTNNFISCSVYRSIDNGFTTNKIAGLVNPDDTTFTDNNPPFGNDIYYSVGITAHGDPRISNIGNGKKGFTGVKSQPALSFFYIPSNNSIYILNYSGVFRIDPLTHSVVASQTSFSNVPEGQTLTVSTNGKYVYLAGFTKFYRLDPLTLSIINTYNINSFTSFPSAINNCFEVNNDNMIAYSCYRMPLPNNFYLVGNKILNMNNNSIMDSLPLSSSGFNCTISDNGKYFFSTSGNFYKISSGKLVCIGTVPALYYRFIENGDKFIYFKK